MKQGEADGVDGVLRIGSGLMMRLLPVNARSMRPRRQDLTSDRRGAMAAPEAREQGAPRQNAVPQNLVRKFCRNRTQAMLTSALGMVSQASGKADLAVPGN